MQTWARNKLKLISCSKIKLFRWGHNSTGGGGQNFIRRSGRNTMSLCLGGGIRNSTWKIRWILIAARWIKTPRVEIQWGQNSILHSSLVENALQTYCKRWSKEECFGVHALNDWKKKEFLRVIDERIDNFNTDIRKNSHPVVQWSHWKRKWRNYTVNISFLRPIKQRITWSLFKRFWRLN